MLGGCLGLGESGNVGIAEVGDDVAQFLGLRLEHRSTRAEQVAICQVNQPLDFNVDAGAVEAGLAQVFAEFAHRGLVSAVKRR